MDLLLPCGLPFLAGRAGVPGSSKDPAPDLAALGVCCEPFFVLSANPATTETTS